MKTIVLTGGGTAGHCAPHYALLPYLKKSFDKIYYIGSSGIEKTMAINNGLSFYEINPTKLKRGLYLDNLLIPFKTVKSVNECVKILKTLKPNVVFSKGGFVGLPVTVASKKLKIPVIIHESDYSLGLANKLAMPYAEKLLTTFEKTAYRAKNSLFVGAIIREELLNFNKQTALKYYGFSGNKPIILITGGSMGAKKLNELTIRILPKLLKDFNVLHLVGKNNLTNANFNGYKQLEFTDMKYAYAVSDLCISRAGSNTAFEIIFNKLPALFMPLPKTESRGDQLENAKFFNEKNLASILYQEDATPNVFYDKIISLYNNRNYYINNLNLYSYPLANQKIIEILNKY